MPGLDDVMANRRDAKMFAAMKNSQPTINVSPVIHLPNDVPVTIKNFDQMVSVLENSLVKIQESLSGLKVELGAEGIKAMAKDITVDVSTDELDATLTALQKSMDGVKDAVKALPAQIKLDIPEMEFPSEMSLTEAKSILGALKDVQGAIMELGKKMPKDKDDKNVVQAVSAVEAAIRGMAFPTPRASVQFREDSQHVSGDTGTMALAVRNDSGSVLAGTDGDYIPLSTDSTGALRVTSGGGGGGSDVQYADAATRGTATGTLMMVDDGTLIQSALGDSSGRQIVNINGTVPVSGTFWQATQPVSGTFFQTTQPISAAALPLPTGASTSALQTTGNTSVGSIDTKTPALGQALAAASVPVVLTAAQVTTLTPPTTVTVTQATGTNLHTVVDSGTLTTVSTVTNLSQLGGAAIAMGTGVRSAGTQRVTIATDDLVPTTDAATSATGSAVPAKASYKGLIAKTANPSAASDGNLVGALADKLGKQVVVGSIRDLKGDQFTTLTSTTTETTIITAVASTFLDLYGLIIENTSATATEVSFRDVAAGSVRFAFEIPAGDTRGFMLPESGAFKQASVNTAWTAQCGTSVASVKISALYVKNI